MAEPKRKPVRNVRTHQIKYVPLAQYRSYIIARDRDTNRPIWEATTPMVGLQTQKDGSFRQVKIPTEHVASAARGGSGFDLWEGEGDNRLEIARQQEIEATRNKLAQERGGMTALDSALSVVTFGATSAAANALAGEEAEQYRQRQIEANPVAHFGGRVAGIAGLGAAPIFGAVGRAKGIANAGSIFEGSAAIAQTARGLVTSPGFAGSVGRRIVGTATFGAVAEAPLSLALAAADIVDNDKGKMSELIAGEFGSQYAWGMGIALATGLPFAFAASGLQALGRGGSKLAVKIGAQDVAQSLLHGGTRYVSRKYLRGQARGLGDTAETAMHRVGGRMVREISHNGSQGRIGRWLAGDNTDNFIKHHRTNARALEDLITFQTPKQAKEAATTLGYNVNRNINPQLSDDLVFIQKNAKNMAKAKEFVDALPQEVQAIAAAADNVRLRSPEGIGFKSKSKEALEGMLRDISLVEPGPLQTKLASMELSRNKAKAFNEVMELRRGMSKGSRDRVAQVLKESVLDESTAGRLDGLLAQLDNFDEMRVISANLAKNAGKAQGVESLAQMEQLRSAAQSLGGSYRGIAGNKLVRNPKAMEKFFDGGNLKISNKFNDIGDGIEALGVANRVYKQLRQDARPLVTAAKPSTQTEILEAQLETVINARGRVTEALKFIGTHGGGGRHTAAFSGVMAFRQMKTMDEKRDTFAVYREALIASASTPSAMQEHVGRTVENVAGADMELGVHLAETIATQNSYLLQQLPRSEDPQVDAGDFSGAEIETFLEAVGAAIDPVSPLYAAADGSTTQISVDTVRTIYPRLYADMVVDVAEFLHTDLDKLGFNQLLGLDTFTGGALGVSDGPAPNLTYDLRGYQTTEQAASMGAVGGPENRRMDIQQNQTASQRVGGL